MSNTIKSIKKIINNNLFMLSYIYRLCPNHIFLTLVVFILGNLSSILNLLVTRYVINAIQIGDESYIWNSVVIMILLLLVLNSLQIYVSTYIQQRVLPKNTQIICQKMQEDLFQKASMIEMKLYDTPEFFNTFSMAIQQSYVRAQGVLNTLSTFLSNLFSISTFAILILFLEPILVILVMINVLVSLCINTAIAKLQHNFFKEKIQPQREMEYSKFIFYRVENAKEIRQCGDIKNVIMDKFQSASGLIINLTIIPHKFSTYTSMVVSGIL